MNQTELEKRIEEIKVEARGMLDNPRTGLRESSNTNKTRYGILGLFDEMEQLLTPQVEIGDTVEKSMLRYIWNDSIFNEVTRKLEVGEKPYQELKEYHFPTNKGDKG